MPPDKPVRRDRILNIIPSAGLRYWIILPFFGLIILLILVLAGLSLAEGGQVLAMLPVAVAALLGVVGLGLVITRHVSQRIGQLITAAEQVARGDLSIRIQDDRNDEIGQLVRAFNQMVTTLDQLHYSRDLLSRTMSPAVRKSLLEKGLDFRGLLQVISILFIDIRDFTRIAEGYNPEQLIFFLNDYYSTIANQVHSGGGIIGKYAGDSILAFFGAPTPQSPAQSSTAAFLTALALQDAIEEMSQRWTILGLPSIRVGIGLSLGPVVAGPIGSEEQFEYTVIGDAVNLASRLQDLTRNVPNYNIILSSDVYEALEDRIKTQIQITSLEAYERLGERERAIRPIQFVDLGEVLVKGKKGPVHVYGVPA